MQLSVIFEKIGVRNGKKVGHHLLKYCKLDTEGMVWIVEELEKIFS